MPNLTLAMPEAMHRRMKQHPEIKWSEVARRAIQEKLEDLEIMEKLARKSKLNHKDAAEIAGKVDREVGKRLA